MKQSNQIDIFIIISLTRVTLEALAAVDAEEVRLVAGGGVHRQEVLLQGLFALEFLKGEVKIWS